MFVPALAFHFLYNSITNNPTLSGESSNLLGYSKAKCSKIIHSLAYISITGIQAFLWINNIIANITLVIFDTLFFVLTRELFYNRTAEISPLLQLFFYYILKWCICIVLDYQITNWCSTILSAISSIQFIHWLLL